MNFASMGNQWCYLANDDSCFLDSLSNISSTSRPAESMLPNRNPVKFTSFSFSFSLSVSILFVYSICFSRRNINNFYHYVPELQKMYTRREKERILFIFVCQINWLSMNLSYCTLMPCSSLAYVSK